MKNCIKYHTKKEFVLSENRKSVRFENADQKNIEQATVDGCLIVEGMRCDFYVCCDGVVFYIELKGSDAAYGFEQICHSIEKFSLEHQKKEKVGILVSSQCPAITSKLQMRMKKCVGQGRIMHDFIIRTNTYKRML